MRVNAKQKTISRLEKPSIEFLRKALSQACLYSLCSIPGKTSKNSIREFLKSQKKCSDKKSIKIVSSYLKSIGIKTNDTDRPSVKRKARVITRPLTIEKKQACKELYQEKAYIHGIGQKDYSTEKNTIGNISLKDLCPILDKNLDRNKSVSKIRLHYKHTIQDQKDTKNLPVFLQMDSCSTFKIDNQANMFRQNVTSRKIYSGKQIFQTNILEKKCIDYCSEDCEYLQSVISYCERKNISFDDL